MPDDQFNETLNEIKGLCPAMYDAVTLTGERQPDWTKFQAQLHSRATLAPASGGDAAILDAGTFIGGMAAQIESGELQSLEEREIACSAKIFGNTAAVRSTFVAAINGETRRGVTFAQIVREAGRWVILSAVWDNETPENPIPENLLS